MSSSIYQVDLSFYKEMRQECDMAHAMTLMSMAKEMIYYNHWANSVMFEFLNSQRDISSIVEDLEMKTIDEYFDTGSLF